MHWLIYNYPQGNLNCSHDKEGVFKEDKSKRTETAAEKTSCKLQIMDSEDEVYVPQTSMEIEYASSINKTQEELKKCMNENLKLKQTISILEKEKETMHRNLSKNADKTKKQVEEIAELRKRLEQLESNSDNFARIRQMISLSKSEAREMDAKGRNESQRQLDGSCKNYPVNKWP